MHRSSVVAVAAVLLLSSCATFESTKLGPIKIFYGRDFTGFDPAHFTAPNGMDANIHIVNGQLVVDQDPMRPTPDAQQKVTVSWALSRTGNYAFPDDGAIQFIRVDDPLPTDTQCATVGGARKFFVCTYTRTRAAKWKYSIRVKDGSGNELTLDPWFFQN